MKQTPTRTWISWLGSLFRPYQLLFGQRDLALFFAGQTAAVVSHWLYVVTLSVLVYDITHSASIVALFSVLRLFPYALLAPLGGALVDRSNPKVVLIAANGGRAVCMVLLISVHSTGTLMFAFPLAIVTTVCNSFFRPARVAILPNVCRERELANANGLLNEIDTVAMGLGPALGGFIILFGQIQYAFLVAAAGFALAAVLHTVMTTTSSTEPESNPSIESASIVQGLRFMMRRHRGVLIAVALTLIGLSMLGGADTAILVVFSLKIFHLGGQGVGFLSAAYAIGALVGGFLVNRVVSRRNLATVFVSTATLSSLAVGLYSFSPTAAEIFGLNAVVGLADVTAKVSAAMLIQIATPRELLGRVTGVFEAATNYSMVVGALTVGPLIVLFGARFANATYAIVGLALLIVSLPGLLRIESVLGARIFLRRVPVLDAVPLHLLDEFGASTVLEKYSRNELILREGEVGQTFYIVKSGRVDVVEEQSPGRSEKVATLGQAQYFGEIALLKEIRRTANVYAHGEVSVYAVNRMDFQNLVRQEAGFRDSLGTEATARLHMLHHYLMPQP
jgi:MFS family permease